MFHHDIIPCIAGFGVKKLFGKVTIKCRLCTNALSHGHGRTINALAKSAITCNAHCINMRDEGGLMWPSHVAVLLCGIIIKCFEKILNSNSLMKDCSMSCSNSRVALLAVKEMVHESIARAPNFNTFKDTCDACGKNLLEHAIKPLMSTYFNAATKNFALLLTRRNAANKLSMKMVKDMKKREGAQI